MTALRQLVNMNIGEKIKHLRKEKSITQVQLAQALKLDKGTIAKYEVGERFPSIHILKQIALYFEVSSDYLLGITDI